MFERIRNLTTKIYSRKPTVPVFLLLSAVKIVNTESFSSTGHLQSHTCCNPGVIQSPGNNFCGMQREVRIPSWVS